MSIFALDIAGGGAGRDNARTIGAIRTASARTGVDFAYMVAQAAMESGFDTRAQATTSSARGLYQFIERTWLGMVRDHGAEVGLADAAAAIETDAAGRATVADPSEKARILALRDDPRLSAEFAARLAQRNRDALAAAAGPEGVGPTDLYLAHFLGAGQATKFLTALDTTPYARAADLFPAEAAANRGVFHGRDGTARTLAEVYARFEHRMTAAMGEHGAGTAGTMSHRPVPPAAPAASATLPAVGMAPAGQGWRPGFAQSAALDPLVILTLAALQAPEGGRAGGDRKDDPART